LALLALAATRRLPTKQPTADEVPSDPPEGEEVSPAVG
jgi:hypothetical protein